MKKSNTQKRNIKVPQSKAKKESYINQPRQKPSLPINNYFSSIWKVGIFLFILVFAVFGNSISNKYSFDDDFVTYNNPQIKKGFKAIPEIFTTHYANTAKQNYEYRPIVKLTYAIEYGLFKESPRISHFFNVLFYFILCLVLYILLIKLLFNYHPLIPLLTVILFAVHPIHTEVVDSLKNRDEMLCLIGGLLSIYSFIRYAENKKWKWIIYGILWLIFSYYSKSSTIVFIALIPLTLYFFTDLKLSHLFYILAGIFVLIVILRVLPRTFLAQSDREILYFENPLYFQKGLFLRAGTAFIAILFYFKMMIFPHPLLFYYGYNQIPVANLLNPWAITSLIITGALFFVAIKLLKRKHALSFGILYFFITISLYLNLIKPPPGIVAERFLFTPSVGFCLAMVIGLLMLFKLDIFQRNVSLNSFKKPIWLFVLVVVPFSVRSMVRNTDWKNFETLYKHDIAYLDNSAKANSVYASLLYEKTFKSKDKKNVPVYANDARNYYKRAIKIYPQYTTCWNNLGVLEYKYFGNNSEAIKCWKEAIRWDTAYNEAMFNLATAYEDNNNLDTAELLYNRTIKLKKDFTPSYSKLGGIYFKRGNMQKAIDINNQMMKIIPTSDEPYINIGNYYLLQKDTINAITMWEKAIEKQPANPGLNGNLARYFYHKGDQKKGNYYNNLAQQKVVAN